ncbi:MAG: LacI family DNA-binding transcriptional regulator [Lachnospiraceae bacterium]|nr:LacI family DNA-binding transcriptional regulator [Lachnospiraceae bacterium]
MSKTVKLSDIAARVGVSTVTVSKALSDKKGVSREMRAKIKEIAEEMGYQTPSAVKKKSQMRSYIFGILIAEHFLGKYDSFYWQMYQDVTTKAVAEGSFTLLELVSAEAEEQMVLPKLSVEKRVNGIIIIGELKKGYLEHLKKECEVPVVYLDFYDGTPDCDAVISNGYHGTYALTNHLFDLGHRRIAFVGNLLATQSITDRYFGYRHALLEHGVEMEPDWLIGDRDPKTGNMDEEQMRRFPKEMPTALVCNCDLTAATMIHILEERGLYVPRDISVVGFDNFLYPWLCRTAITTYEPNSKAMVAKALEKLICKIEDAGYQPGIFTADGHLVYGESAARIPLPERSF